MGTLVLAVAGRALAAGDPRTFGRRPGPGCRPLPGGPRSGCGPPSALAGVGARPPAATRGALGTRRPLGLYPPARQPAVRRPPVRATPGVGRAVPPGAVPASGIVTAIVPITRLLSCWAPLRIRCTGAMAAVGSAFACSRTAAPGPPGRLRGRVRRHLARPARTTFARPSASAPIPTRVLAGAGGVAPTVRPFGTRATGVGRRTGLGAGRPTPVKALRTGRCPLASRPIGTRETRAPG